MRFGVILSVAIHVGLATAGLIVAPALAPADPKPFMILPVELLEVSDTTNVIPVTEDAKDAEVAETKEAAAEPAAAPPPPPAEDTVALPTEEKPEPKKPDSKKAEANPAPTKKAKEQDFQSALQGILNDVKRDAAPAPSSSNKPTNIATVNDAGARAGTGDMKRMTMTVADAIKSQLLSNQCWTDQDDMADSRRLRAVITIRFGRNFKFSMAPKLREPSSIPSNDPVLQVFIQRAFTALNKCNSIGFKIPQDYFDKMGSPELDIDFLP